MGSIMTSLSASLRGKFATRLERLVNTRVVAQSTRDDLTALIWLAVEGANDGFSDIAIKRLVASDEGGWLFLEGLAMSAIEQFSKQGDLPTQGNAGPIGELLWGGVFDTDGHPHGVQKSSMFKPMYRKISPSKRVGFRVSCRS